MFLLILEALEKRRILRAEYKASPPEATASIFNRSFFWWLNPLFMRGFTSLLRLDDLFEVDKQMRSEYVHEQMEQAYNKGTSSALHSRYCKNLIIISHQKVTKHVTQGVSEDLDMASSGGYSSSSMPSCAQLYSAATH